MAGKTIFPFLHLLFLQIHSSQLWSFRRETDRMYINFVLHAWQILRGRWPMENDERYERGHQSGGQSRILTLRRPLKIDFSSISHYLSQLSSYGSIEPHDIINCCF